MDNQKTNLINQVSEMIIQGNYKLISGLVQTCLDNGFTSSEILNHGLLKGMEVVGNKFRDGLMFLPEVLMSAKSFKTAMNLLEPLLLEENPIITKTRGKILLGTVKGDIHDIGKNLVGVMLKGNGFIVSDIGVDAPVERFIEGIEREKPDIVGLSAMLTTTMISMQKIVQVLKEKYDSQIVIVGGAPVSQNFATEIGADGYAKNAIEAIELCKLLLNSKTNPA